MAIIESSRRRAVESLLEDEAITADLIDEAACPLLDWGIAQVDRLAEREEDDEISPQQLEHRLTALRRKMKYIGRKAGEVPPEAQAERVRALIAEIELPAPVEQTSETDKNDV
ncbi:MAG TPA: hypothetical protein ENN19_14090 [Chloroflexi bacterium]|nr:hypothetical protein [Chloroflexota bacterium]